MRKEDRDAVRALFAETFQLQSVIIPEIEEIHVTDSAFCVGSCVLQRNTSNSGAASGLVPSSSFPSLLFASSEAFGTLCVA